MLFAKASFPNYVFAAFPPRLPGHQGHKEPDSQSHSVPLTGESCNEESPNTHLLLYKQEINHCELSDFGDVTQHRTPYCNEAFGYMGTLTGITLQKRRRALVQESQDIAWSHFLEYVMHSSSRELPC